MKRIVEGVKQVVAPSPEEVWERGGADMWMVEIDPGRWESVPFFYIEVDSERTERTPATEEKVYDELDRHIATTYSQDVFTSDGIDRSTRLHLPTDEYRNQEFNFIVQLTTPWLTSIDGHNDATAALLAKELRVPVLEIGAEHSSRVLPFPLEGLRLAKTFTESQTISLAKTAESCQAITAYLCEKYDLPRNIVKVGESRGAMEAPAEFVYAPYVGNRVVYADTTAPCVPDQLFTHKSDLLRLGQFPGSEVAGFAIVALEAVKKRALSEVKGTLTANPNFWLSSIVGTGSALMSGEAGRFAAWVPREERMGNIHIVTFKNDAVSRPNTWKRLYKPNQGVAIITLRGSHVTLAHSETLRHIVDRIRQFGLEFAAKHEDLSQISWEGVHLKDDDAVLLAA